jgi:hypothetical protein
MASFFCCIIQFNHFNLPSTFFSKYKSRSQAAFDYYFFGSGGGGGGGFFGSSFGNLG